MGAADSYNLMGWNNLFPTNNTKTGSNAIVPTAALGGAQSLGLPTSNLSSWAIPQQQSAFPSMVPVTTGMNTGVGPTIDRAAGLPGAQGDWFDMKGKGGMLLGSAQVGLGAYSAYNQEKQNDFMRGYYNNQMALQKTDFMNAAKTTNNELAAREGRRLSASQGLAYDSAANQAGRADYMKNWGVKETF